MYKRREGRNGKRSASTDLDRGCEMDSLDVTLSCTSNCPLHAYAKPIISFQQTFAKNAVLSTSVPTLAQGSVSFINKTRANLQRDKFSVHAQSAVRANSEGSFLFALVTRRHHTSIEPAKIRADLSLKGGNSKFT